MPRLSHRLPDGMLHPCTTDPVYADDETEFMMAMDSYKLRRKRPFPTCREVLLVLKSLGYRKVAEDNFKEFINGTNRDRGAKAE